MASWRIIDFTNAKVDLGTERGKLTVKSRETDNIQAIPWDEINIMLCGLDTHYTGGVLHQAVKFDCICLFTDWRRVPVGGVYPMYPDSKHNRVAARQIAQANLSEPRRKNAWMQIVRAKILGQSHNLNLLNDENGALRLRNIANDIKTGDTNNQEGLAAKYYWSRLYNDWSRNQDADDFRNSALNYAYTILRGHAIRSLLSAGLSPTLGLFHHNRANFFCLADDLMEPFRPAVDYIINDIQPNNELDSKTKTRLVEGCNQKFLSNGLTIPSVLNDLAQQFGGYVEGVVDRLMVSKLEFAMKYDKEESVWLVCMFDLPVLTKPQRRVASKFRKYLLDIGFSMIQLSVYVKYTPTISETKAALKSVHSVIPPQGGVRVLKVTERQYSAMMNYYNDKPTPNEEKPEQLTLFDEF